jgi:hypothetical protein
MTAPAGSVHARSRADDERRRAARTAQIAARHEQGVEGEPSLQAFHLRMAAIHRQVQRQHLAAAAIHAVHADRSGIVDDLRAWPQAQPALVTPGQTHMFLVALVSTLAENFDSSRAQSRFVGECVAMLDVAAAALVLADQDGKLTAAVCSGEGARSFTRAELARGDGPGMECHRTGRYGAYPTTSALAVRWPHLAGAARRGEIAGAFALPLRRRDTAIGVLILFNNKAGQLSHDVLQLAQLLAAVATIGLVNQRMVDRHERTSAQLQTALTSRITIEQAKGILAERMGIPMGAAFALLRGHARANSRNLHEVAAEIIDSALGIAAPDQIPDPRTRVTGSQRQSSG